VAAGLLAAAALVAAPEARAQRLVPMTPGEPVIDMAAPRPAKEAVAPRPAPETRPRRSTAMMITGISLLVTGAAQVPVGAATFAVATGDCDIVSRIGNVFGCGPEGAKAFGLTLMITGGIAVAVGIPFLVVGAKRVDPPSGAVALPRSSASRAGGTGPGEIAWSF
jgi:hypothetical protein